MIDVRASAVALVRRFQPGADAHAMFDRLVTFAGSLGFPLVAYLALQFEAGVSRFLLTNAPDQWRRAYELRGYRYVDPVVAKAIGADAPFLWAREDYEHAHSRVVNLFTDASRYGISSGYTVPLRSVTAPPAALIFMRDGVRAELEAKLLGCQPDLLYVAVHFNAAVTKRQLPRRGDLEPLEARCLGMMAAGYTNQQIAELTGQAERTVKYMLDRLRDKFGALNRQHLVHIAHEIGIL